MFGVIILVLLLAGCSDNKAAPVNRQAQAAPVYVSKAVLKRVPIEIETVGTLSIRGRTRRRWFKPKRLSRKIKPNFKPRRRILPETWLRKNSRDLRPSGTRSSPSKVFWRRTPLNRRIARRKRP